jgi:DNA-binding transcriptional LysR family regulator
LDAAVTPLTSLDSLRCFLAAARALNFRNASRAVALTPTAFSQRILQLEDMLGCKLFVRTTRSVTLTEEGLALVPRAERCLAAADDCAAVGHGEASRPEMDLTIGTRQELGMSWALPQRAALMRTRPWLHLHYYFGSGLDLFLRLRTMEIDCAITSSHVGDPKLDAFQLHREDYAFVGAKRLLAKTPLARAEDAPRHTLLDASADLPLFRYWRDAPGGGDRLRFRRGTWLGSIDAIRHQALEGAGVAVLPLYFVRDDLSGKRLVRVFPSIALVHDFFRFVFRASDPRRSLFEAIAREMAEVPLR